MYTHQNIKHKALNNSHKLNSTNQETTRCTTAASDGYQEKIGEEEKY
jgi:hypothetical protein